MIKTMFNIQTCSSMVNFEYNFFGLCDKSFHDFLSGHGCIFQGSGFGSAWACQEFGDAAN